MAKTIEAAITAAEEAEKEEENIAYLPRKLSLHYFR